jgi:hypothetical protein
MGLHTNHRLHFLPTPVISKDYILCKCTERRLTSRQAWFDSAIHNSQSPTYKPLFLFVMSQLNVNPPSREGELQTLCQIATPVGMLGYGLDEEQFDAALKCLTSVSVPTAIILDSGSTDGGPSKLAIGVMSCPKSSYKRDLTKLIDAVLKYQVPLLISSAGGDGSNPHVDEIVDIIQEILKSL